MDRFHELRVFVAIADCGGLAKAARAIHASPPAVTRTLSALEERLGVRLFDRTTRSLRLTDPGTRFLEDARRLLSELESAEELVTGQSVVPAGKLSITASLSFGRAVLQPIVADFLNANPRISVSLQLHDRVVDLIDEGFDLAIRIANLPDSTFAARPVGKVRRMLVASPAYLAKRGMPARPDDLKLHAIIVQSTLMPDGEWRYVDDGQSKRIALPARLEINDAHACLVAAEAGSGIAIALSYMVTDALAARRLVPVLDELAPPPVPVNVVYAQRRIVAPKVRAFVDFAVPRLRAVLGAAN